MGWLDSILGAAKDVSEKLGITGALEGIKSAIQGRAAEAPYPVEEAATAYERYAEAWREADYRSFAVPIVPEMIYERQSIFPGSLYGQGPEDMDSNYITFFGGAGYDMETGEEDYVVFSVKHDDLLYDEEMEEIAEEMAAAYGFEGFESLTPISGISRFPEEYME